jgi:hypothetical protein
MFVKAYIQQIFITSIYLPHAVRKQGFGLRLIAFIYNIAKNIHFDLVLANLTDSFQDVMINQGTISYNRTGLFTD